MDAEALAKEMAEQARRAEEALRQAQEAAAAMETTTPPFWQTEGQ